MSLRPRRSPMNIRKLDSLLLDYALTLPKNQICRVGSKKIKRLSLEVKNITKLYRNQIINEFWKLKEESDEN